MLADVFLTCLCCVMVNMTAVQMYFLSHRAAGALSFNSLRSGWCARAVCWWWTECVGKRWSAHLSVSKHTAIRLLKCRGRKMWRPFLFIYQELIRLPVHRINIEGWKESSWLNQLPGRWRMPGPTKISLRAPVCLPPVSNLWIQVHQFLTWTSHQTGAKANRTYYLICERQL